MGLNCDSGGSARGIGNIACCSYSGSLGAKIYTRTIWAIKVCSEIACNAQVSITRGKYRCDRGRGKSGSDRNSRESYCWSLSSLNCKYYSLWLIHTKKTIYFVKFSRFKRNTYWISFIYICLFILNIYFFYSMIRFNFYCIYIFKYYFYYFNILSRRCLLSSVIY